MTIQHPIPKWVRSLRWSEVGQEAYEPVPLTSRVGYPLKLAGANEVLAYSGLLSSEVVSR